MPAPTAACIPMTRGTRRWPTRSIFPYLASLPNSATAPLAAGRIGGMFLPMQARRERQLVGFLYREPKNS